MNMLHATGNLGGDATLRHLPSGSDVLNFSVAMTAGYKDNEQTIWVSCSLFGQRASTLQQYLTKGTKVAIAGEVRLREWTNQSGEAKTSLDCNVRELTLLGSPQQQGRQQAPAQAPQRAPEPAPAKAGTSAPDLLDDDQDDDIPF